MAEHKLDGWLTTGEVANLAGVTPAAVIGWLKRNRRRSRDYRWTGRTYLVHPGVAEAYLNRRGIPAGAPSPGMVRLIDLVSELSLPYNRTHGYCSSGRARCVRWRDVIYVNRYDVLAIIRSELPDGWVWVSEAARELGMDPGTLRKRLYRSGADLRRLHGRLIVRWADVLDVRDVLPAGAVPALRVARQAGVTRDAVTAWARAHGYPVYYAGGPAGRIAYVSAECASVYLAQRERRREAVA